MINDITILFNDKILQYRDVFTDMFTGNYWHRTLKILSVILFLFENVIY